MGSGGELIFQGFVNRKWGHSLKAHYQLCPSGCFSAWTYVQIFSWSFAVYSLSSMWHTEVPFPVRKTWVCCSLTTQGKSEPAQERADVCEGSPRELQVTCSARDWGDGSWIFPTPKRASLHSAEKSLGYRGGNPWSRSQNLLASLFEAENLFAGASLPCPPVILPPHHLLSTGAEGPIPHPSLLIFWFSKAPRGSSWGAGEDVGESPEGMTAGDPCQIHGRKESSYPSLCQLLEHWHPCETPPLAKRADAFTAAL